MGGRSVLRALTLHRKFHFGPLSAARVLLRAFVGLRYSIVNVMSFRVERIYAMEIRHFTYTVRAPFPWQSAHG